MGFNAGTDAIYVDFVFRVRLLVRSVLVRGDETIAEKNIHMESIYSRRDACAIWYFTLVSMPASVEKCFPAASGARKYMTKYIYEMNARQPTTLPVRKCWLDTAQLSNSGSDSSI